MSLLSRLKRFIADLFGGRPDADDRGDAQARQTQDAPKNVVENLEKLS